MSRIAVELELDGGLVARARAAGPLDRIVSAALREALSPETVVARRRWAEDNALLIEAVGGGAEELKRR
jgi:post-segregation antitoxin (ccd killing protein)